MADYRGRDRIIYDPDAVDHVYPQSGARFRSPSPSPDRMSRYERRPQRFHDDFTDDGRSDIDFRGRPGPAGGYYHDEPQPRYIPREMSPDYRAQRAPERRAKHSSSGNRRPSAARPRVDPAGDDFMHAYGNSPDVTHAGHADRRRPHGQGGYRDEFSDSHSLTSGAGLGLGYPAAAMPPAPSAASAERVREREVVKVHKRRSRSRSRESLTSRSYSRRSSSRSRSSSSRSSSPSRATSVRSGGDSYPKKGKTKIPSKLLSKRALLDLGYPFLDEGNTIIILKALNQEQIDQVLRVSEEYKKLEISAARSSAGNIAEERLLEDLRMAQAPSIAPAPIIMEAAPRQRQSLSINPLKSTYTSTTFPSTITDSTITAPVVYERRRRHSGPLVVRRKSRSRSRHGKDIRAEIRALEAELYERKSHKHRPRGDVSVGGDLVRVDRLGDGQVVMFEERVEKVEEGYRGPRIERDKRGPPPALVRAMLKTVT
ncbi:unnamed protein product [Parascedosporium putredinis]|uniref:DUF8035 domain-containing protein n=1 Tax=Parascedosporium putredinis TaxID=1442378 RepID=A0A9P1H024_9PEZI|nr:unnamed protein product [Parascedosporium putredinis]CAI7992272.1 unnamed protein product [Parascedosporium putredinis]